MKEGGRYPFEIDIELTHCDVTAEIFHGNNKNASEKTGAYFIVADIWLYHLAGAHTSH